MDKYFQEMRDRQKTLTKQLEALEGAIRREEQLCTHIWNERYTPEYRQGYTIPGDAPGTMGVDWRGPTYVEPKTTPKWTRTCTHCGKVETTTRARTEIQKTDKPNW